MADLVYTVGGATSNSFISTDDADTYFDNRLNASAWTVDASSDEKDQALITASKELNILSWLGYKATTAQRLAWPRSMVINPDSAYSQEFYSESEIPQRVKDATCEYALELLKAGTTDLTSQDSSREIKSETVGPISVTYAEPSQKSAGLSRFPNVTSGLGPLLSGLSHGQIKLVRG
jgi:hypothetical protein